jgi:hypothetical protein
MSPSLAMFLLIRNGDPLARAASREVRPLQPTMGLAGCRTGLVSLGRQRRGGVATWRDPVETT